MEKALKKDSGITLVALIVTIIILVILAGVSISLVLGNNGIIQKALMAKENSQKASEQENMELKNAENYFDKLANKEENKETNEDSEETKKIKKICDDSLLELFNKMNTQLTANDLKNDSDLLNQLNMKVDGPHLNQDDGNVITSAQYPGLPAWQAFSNLNSRYNSGDTDKWPTIGYDFKNNVYINSIYIENFKNDTTAVKQFNVQYSNDNTNWKNANSSPFTIGNTETKKFNLDSTNIGRYWRIQILSNYGYGNYNCSLTHLFFYGLKMNSTTSKEQYFEDEIANNIANSIIDNGKVKLNIKNMLSNGEFKNKILNSKDLLNYIKQSNYETYKYIYASSNVCNPYMTSNSSPSGNVSYSSFYYQGYFAFDSDPNNGWTPSGNEDSTKSYLQYDFGKEFTAGKIVLSWGCEGREAFGFKYKLQGSNDGTTFIDITQERETSKPTIETINLEQINSYRYYRIQFLTSGYVLHLPYSYSTWVKDFRIYGY